MDILDENTKIGYVNLKARPSYAYATKKVIAASFSTLQPLSREHEKKNRKLGWSCS